MKIHYVVGFCFSYDLTEVVLIRKNKPDWQKGKLNGVGGKVEPFDIDANEAMSREFHEEAGLVIPSNLWSNIGRMEGHAWVVDIFYTTWRGLALDVKTMTEEKIEVLPTDDVRSGKCNTLTNVSWLVSCCLAHMKDKSFMKVKVEYE